MNIILLQTSFLTILQNTRTIEIKHPTNLAVNKILFITSFDKETLQLLKVYMKLKLSLPYLKELLK